MTEASCCLSVNNQADVIESFNSTSRYLDDLLNIDKNMEASKDQESMQLSSTPDPEYRMGK